MASIVSVRKLQVAIAKMVRKVTHQQIVPYIPTYVVSWYPGSCVPAFLALINA